ncbi:MAG TPA: FixH family protein [Gemmatimonadales bacterium]|nr:FixH family protein [Gemmatimonadales bacterium]
MRKRSLLNALLILGMSPVLLGMSGCGMITYTLRHGFSTPPASEFGLGPRTSAGGRYVATIDTASKLVTGKLQMIRLTVKDSTGAAVTGASITVDGGMPQHGHGLPTHPRVTAEEPNGVYVVDGLKFNMGGWWELRFTITTTEGAETVTFNVRL